MKTDKRKQHAPTEISDQNLRHARGGVTLIGFGTFSVANRKEKRGVKPPTNES